MERIYTKYSKNIPILKFTGCANCSMSYGKHNNNLVNRGCCWYDTEFDLYDLKNLIDINADILYNLLQKYTYQTQNNGLYYSVEFSALHYSKNNKDNKICVFFQEGKGCKLPIYARPFICRITLCPQIRLYLSPEDYQRIRSFIGKAYQHRLNSIEEIKQKIDFNSLKSENIYEIINALKSIPSLLPIDKTHIEILIENN
jgi:hypothetical protein